jgi:hypothetical protein
MAIVIRSKTSAYSPSGTISLTIPPTIPGSVLFVCVNMRSPTGAVVLANLNGTLPDLANVVSNHAAVAGNCTLWTLANYNDNTSYFSVDIQCQDNFGNAGNPVPFFVIAYEITGLDTAQFPNVAWRSDLEGTGNVAVGDAITLDSGDPRFSSNPSIFFADCGTDSTDVSAAAAPWVTDVINVNGVNQGFSYLIADGTGTYTPSYPLTGTVNFVVLTAAFFGSPGAPPPPPPPPPPELKPCAPLASSGNPVNGVFVEDLSLFIIPATSLYKDLIPFSAITVNESHVEGRSAVILDFNNSEGVYSRDMGTIFTWPVFSETILDVWQPSVIPMDGEVYDRLSYHCLMTSLGTVGWQHAREMNIAYAAPAGLTLLLQFDQWPDITLSLPASVNEIKQKLTLPPNKFKLVEVFLSSPSPFKLWTNDLEMKIKQWGSAEPYRVARPVAG